MWARRLSIVAGFVVGIVAAGLVLGGILAFAPDPPPPSTPVPTTAIPTSSPSPSASAPPTTTAVPSASAADGPFRIGQPAPPMSGPKVGGGTIDLATLRGKPAWIYWIDAEGSSATGPSAASART